MWSILAIVLIASPFAAYVLYMFSKNKRIEKPCILSHIGQERLGPYYMSLKEKLVPEWQKKFKRNDDGAFLSYDHSSKSWYVNAVDNCHQALAYYERYVESHAPEDLSKFLKITEAIIKSTNIREDDCMVLEYPIQYYKNQKTPWLSAMGQGQLLLIIARAFQETSEDRFIRLGKMALMPFTKDILEGGVRCVDPKRGIFYEEYAYWEKNKQHHTLNGMMSALMGIYDFWKVSNDVEAKQIFDVGIETLIRNLDAYEFPFGTTYDLRHEHGEPHNFLAAYHSVHISHLRVLHALTNNRFFLQKAELWDRKLLNLKDRLWVTYYRLIMRFDYMMKEKDVYGGWPGYLTYEAKRLLPRVKHF